MSNKKISVEQFIASTLSRIEEQCRRQELSMTETSVTMKRRYRDYDLSDNLDIFKNGYWTNIPWADRNFYALNIIKPTIRANTAAIMTTNVKVDIEPRFLKDTKAKMAAEVAKAIRDLKYDEQWTTELLEQVANECQTAPGCFLRVRYKKDAVNPFGVDAAHTEWGEDDMTVGGLALCGECGAETSGDVRECPECGYETEVIEEAERKTVPVMAEKDDEEGESGGNTVTEFIPFSEIRVDTTGTQGGRLANALWLEHHHLMPSWEAGAEQTVTAFSLPQRWQLALATGLDYYGGALGGRLVVDHVEVRDLYLRHEFLEQVEELSQRFEVGHFAVDAGQKFEDATYKGRRIGKKTLCFRTVGNRVLDVYPCEFDTFDQEFIYFTMAKNPTTFWGLFLTELLPMQDAINYMITLQIFHTRRNARTTLILDSEAFDPEDMERDIAVTRPEYTRPVGEPIGNMFDVVPALTLSGEPMAIINMIMQYKGDVGGVQPSMVGGDASSQGYNTASGQMLAKNQSMMMLAAFSQSVAKGKEAWVRKQLVEAQKTWTQREFGFLLRMNGDWTEEWIDAFLETNIQTDLVIEYVPGSDVPRTLLEREWALRQFMQDMLVIQQAMGQPLAPDTAAEILQKIKQYTDVDIDIKNQDAELSLIDRRYDLIKKMSEGLEIPPEASPEEVGAVALQLVTANPALHPFERENHSAAVEWLTDRIITLGQEEVPNRLLIECLKQYINVYEAAAVALAQKQTQMQVAAQAPAMEAQQQQAMQAQAMEAEQAAAEREQTKADEEDARVAEREAKYDDAALDLEKERQKAMMSQDMSAVSAGAGVQNG